MEEKMIMNGHGPERKMEDQIADAKSKWDEAIGIKSELVKGGFFILRSPTGFPLATMNLSGCKPSFGYSPAMQDDWLENRPPLTDKRVNDDFEAAPTMKMKGV